MPRVKSAQDIAEKWARVAPDRQRDFESGVRDPEVEWARNTAAAAETFAAGVSDAIQRGAFAKGVERAGNDKWRRKTQDVGVARWGPGVRAAQQDFEDGFAPFREIIERTDLPPRRPRGDPANLERAAIMARALAEARRR